MELFRDVAEKKRKFQEKPPICLERYLHQECQKQKGHPEEGGLFSINSGTVTSIAQTPQGQIPAQTLHTISIKRTQSSSTQPCGSGKRPY